MTIANTMDDEIYDLLFEVESLLALLHYRGLVDNEPNREDVARLLIKVRNAVTR